MITQERLKQVLHYDRKTGIFTWLKSHQKVQVGDPAGCLDAGYIKIKVDGRKYRAHQLAWLYCYGFWPKQIDHRDLDKSHNAIANLREATHRQNNANKPLQRNNTSGSKGVYFFKPRQRWRAVIYENKKQKCLGTFHTKAEAVAAYNRAAIQEFGDFARAA